MKRSILWALGASALGLVVACGGSDAFSLDTDGGPDGEGADGGTGTEGGNDATSDAPGDTGGGGDAVADSPVSCEGGTIDCGGTCVDTSTDPSNCGGCGVDCTGGSCNNGVCKLLPPDAGPPPQVGDFACIGIDAQSVYVATGLNPGNVYKVPIKGGAPSVIVNNQNRPHGIASDGTNIFWTNTGSGEIMKADTNGNNAVAIVTGQVGPFNITVDSSGVYWDAQGNNNPTPGSVWRADKNGQNVKQLYSGLTPFHVGWVAVDANNVYFPDLLANTIFSAQKNGATVAKVIATDPQNSRPIGVAVDTKNVYWTDQSSGLVRQMSLQPNSQASSIATGQSGPTGVTTDGVSVYWVNPSTNQQPNTGTIQKVAVGGGAVSQLANAQNWPNCIAVDGTSVYWINEGGGMISKTGK